MLEAACGLPSAVLAAIADLERRVLAVDGGRLKLEWGTLRSRSGRQVEDLLWWDDGTLMGFLGLYSFGPAIELAGMVAPEARRQGIGAALLDAALPLCRERGSEQALLVVPRSSVAGRQLAETRGARLEHSEHALVQRVAPPSGPGDSRVTLRPALPADVAVLTELLEAGFGHPAPDVAAELASAAQPTLMIDVDGRPIGTIRLSRDGDSAGVYGFVIAPQWRGRGIGRDVLRRVCEQLRREGAERVGLEVAVDNDSALGLYTSIGFERVMTEDYYALPLS